MSISHLSTSVSQLDCSRENKTTNTCPQISGHVTSTVPSCGHAGDISVVLLTIEKLRSLLYDLLFGIKSDL